MTIKIIITDDHPLVVSGLQSILKGVSDIDVMATCNSGDELMLQLKQEIPDVLLTDLQMPGKLSGLELIHALRRIYPQLPVLVLSGQETIFNVHDIMELGCKGYLLKNSTDPDMLVKAIKEVWSGGIYLEPQLKDELLRSILKTKKENEQLTNMVSRREIEVLKLIDAGYSNQEMADKLYLSIRTIESHRMRLIQKLDVKNVASLLKKARTLGLID